MCKRITGQAGDEYGAGSIAWINSAANVERWAWYSTYNTKSVGATGGLLINSDAELLPPGRALMNELSSSVDCDAAP